MTEKTANFLTGIGVAIFAIFVVAAIICVAENQIKLYQTTNEANQPCKEYCEKLHKWSIDCKVPISEESCHATTRELLSLECYEALLKWKQSEVSCDRIPEIPRRIYKYLEEK